LIEAYPDDDSWETGTDPCGDGQIRCFDALLYGIDTVIPIVDLSHLSTWYPNPHAPTGGA